MGISAAALVCVILFYAIYSHTTGLVLRHPEDAEIRYIEIGFSDDFGDDNRARRQSNETNGTHFFYGDGDLTEEQSKEILTYLSHCQEKHTLRRSWSWNGGSIVGWFPIERYGMTIMIDTGSGARGILLANDDICGGGMLNLTYDMGNFHIGSYFHFRGDLIDPKGLRDTVHSMLQIDSEKDGTPYNP